MKNKNVRGILALALVTALSFGVILGSKALTTEKSGNSNAPEEKVLAELDVNGAENIEKAVETEDGYMVTVRTKGYVADIVMNVSFDKAGTKVTKVEVTEQNETQDVGAKIAEDEFLSQFAGVEAPVYLPGMTSEENKGNALEGAVLADGTYEAKAAEPQNGYTDVMMMTVADGKITEVVWDALDEEGNKKSILSEEGKYVMTDDGPTWKAQAEALAAALVQQQALDFLAVNEQGKTDAVSGVSIAVGGFIAMAEDCMNQAAGYEAPEAAPQNGTQADAVSGATLSSKAAVKGINDAYHFLQSAK